MKTLWRIIASILTTFMAITFIPISSINVHASENVIDSGTCGDLITWILTDSGTLTISGVGDITSCPWNSKDIKTVIISNGITSICDGAFSGCESLTSINIPEGITKINKRAFYGCTSLKSVTIPKSAEYILNEAFAQCLSLTSLTISKGVRDIGYQAFLYCHSLTSITIPNSVRNIDNDAFRGCSSITDVYYTGSEAEWKDISNISNASKDLEAAVLHYDTPNVGACGEIIASGISDDMFTWTLTDYGVLTISGEGDMTSAPWKSMYLDIKTVRITNGITSICNDAFSGCRSLSSVTIPESVYSIGDRAFSNCISLTSVYIPDWVSNIGSDAFSYCTSLSSVTIPEEVIQINNGTFYCCKSLKSVIIPKYVREIGAEAFSRCSSLSCVLMHSRVKSISNSAFSYCSSLYHVYYTGSESDWKKISNYSKDIMYSTIHFNTTLLPRFALGDVSGDCIISSKDSNIIKRIIIGSYEPDENQLITADINKDQVINTKDIFLLKKMIITFMM